MIPFRVLVPALAALALVACSEKRGGEAPPAAKTQAAGSAVTMKGSDTMVLLGQRVAEQFMAKNPGKTVQVTGGGSGTGIAALINGTTDLANASRPMKDSEKKQVQQKRGKPAIEHKVALDGLAVFVHKDNAVPALSLPQLKAIYTGEVKNWNEVGGKDARIVVYGRENNSGTYAYFKENVLEDEDFMPETQTLPGTAAVVNAVRNDPNAIGYGGIAYDAGIRAIPVKKDEASEPVEPTMENVTSGKYPISRYLLVYTAGEATGDVKAVLDFFTSEEGQKIAAEVGYYPLPKSGETAGGK